MRILSYNQIKIIIVVGVLAVLGALLSTMDMMSAIANMINTPPPSNPPRPQMQQHRLFQAMPDPQQYTPRQFRPNRDDRTSNLNAHILALNGFVDDASTHAIAEHQSEAVRHMVYNEILIPDSDDNDDMDLTINDACDGRVADTEDDEDMDLTDHEVANMVNRRPESGSGGSSTDTELLLENLGNNLGYVSESDSAFLQNGFSDVLSDPTGSDGDHDVVHAMNPIYNDPIATRNRLYPRNGNHNNIGHAQPVVHGPVPAVVHAPVPAVVQAPVPAVVQAPVPAAPARRNRGPQYGKYVTIHTDKDYDEIKPIFDTPTAFLHWGYGYKDINNKCVLVIFNSARQSYATAFQNALNDPNLLISQIKIGQIADLYHFDKEKEGFFEWKHQSLIFLPFNLAKVSSSTKCAHVWTLVFRDGYRDWIDVVGEFPEWGMDRNLKTSFHDALTLYMREQRKLVDNHMFSGLILRPFQQQLMNEIDTACDKPMETDSREIGHLYDRCGNTGKSVLCGVAARKHPRDVLVITGLSDANNICELFRHRQDVKVLLVDLSRMDGLEKFKDGFGVFEQIKNRILTLTKYMCCTVQLVYNVYILLLCNSMANKDWWTPDRFHARQLVKDDMGNIKMITFDMQFD